MNIDVGEILAVFDDLDGTLHAFEDLASDIVVVVVICRYEAQQPVVIGFFDESQGSGLDHIDRAVVTVVATGTNIVLLKYVHTPLILTWVCVYAVAINLSYVLNSVVTFQSSLSFQRMGIYYGIYLSSMGIGVALLKLYRAVLTWENWILPLLVLPITALWNFSLSSVF